MSAQEQTLFAKQAYSDSEAILSNVRQNLINSLQARGLTERHFYEWAKQQGVKEVVIARYKRYPPIGFNMNTIDSDHLSAVCLCARYMNVSPERAMFGVMSVEQHRIEQKRVPSASNTWT